MKIIRELSAGLEFQLSGCCTELVSFHVGFFLPPF